jgi:hypothetical protein
MAQQTWSHHAKWLKALLAEQMFENDVIQNVLRKSCSRTSPACAVRTWLPAQ